MPSFKTLVGRMRELPVDRLLEMFDAAIRPEITERAFLMEATHIAVFEVLQMDSSSSGQCSAVCVGGPDSAYRTLKEAAAGRLGDIPSQFSYPTYYCEFDSRGAEYASEEEAD